QLAEHHQLRQGRDAAGAPDPAPSADRLDSLFGEMKRKALVPTFHMVMGADELVSRPADQERSGDQLVRPPLGPIAESTAPHVGDGEPGMPLDERLVRRPGAAPEVEDRQRPAAKDLRGGEHVAPETTWGGKG